VWFLLFEKHVFYVFAVRPVPEFDRRDLVYETPRPRTPALHAVGVVEFGKHVSLHAPTA